MDLDAYRRLRADARRVARRPEDADDLVQDALLIALEQGRECDAAWLAGILRNQAAMQARGAIRRRRRDALAVAGDRTADAPPVIAPTPTALLARLPPAARRVAVLALHGLNADEIRWVLGVSATAFRQRLTRIRREIGDLPPSLRGEALALAYVRDPARSVDLQFGLIRRALKVALRGTAGLGSHDPDGHLLVLRGRAHTSAPGGNEEG